MDLAQRIIIRRYADQHYSTVFNPITGFFARVEDKGYKEPFWAKHGPELLDIAITNWCDRNCDICYRESSKSGAFMLLCHYERIMQQAQRMNVAQIALGGGNPNQHPDFARVLQLTREKYGMIPSYTTNGRGLAKDVLLASKKYCGAVAVSAYSPYEEMARALYLLSDFEIKTNIHFILNCESIETAIAWLENPPSFMNIINAIVFLNYKPLGRTVNSDLILNRSGKLRDFFKIATTRRHKFKVGFDCCLVSGLARYSETDVRFYDACEAGRFSMFISEKMEAFPCSFMEGGFKGIPISDRNMLDVWQNGRQFENVRRILSSERCPDCGMAPVCLGGCPLFEDINLCKAAKNDKTK